ncbi:hypothetical protein BMS3Abin08_00835 [bacterium BMS3Abin08]|nr:hypothetical protein BMS3Abin08_00835 [bacterium BMS3Abin08]
MSDFAKTLHLPATLGGFSDFMAISANSSTLNLNLSACWSRNDPVPAAQTEFNEKSLTDSPSVIISLESSPPISKIVLTSGLNRFVAIT